MSGSTGVRVYWCQGLLVSGSTSARVVIKKSKDSGTTKVEILDAEVRAGSCLDSDLSCNFDGSTCGYEISQRLWKLSSSNTHSNEKGFPTIDGNSNTDSGQYLKTKVNKRNPEAHVTLPILRSDQACVRFYYTIYGAGKLDVGKKESHRIYKTFSNLDPRSRVSHPKWRVGEVNIELSEDESFQLTFKAVAPASGEESKIALDGVKVTRHSCYYYDDHDSPKGSSVTTEASCTFDDVCNSTWTAPKSSKGWSWRLQQGRSRQAPPLYDHTNGDAQSYFMSVYVRWSRVRQPVSTRLRGPDYDRRHDATGPNCFSFWYYMQGNKVPRLSAYFLWEVAKLQAGTPRQPLWTREGHQGSGWRQAFVHTPYPGQNKGHVSSN
ncbi:MAM and LDL-receptor class A domain-containing protein 1-like [Elysia marginata]|uniref:MAM and LDL-receptor class A domain-containing protein 1-like n=1 Tax=Elysia marginata TaxID=1093978 RepID=A0AAV4I731_9GAST|nr:MAM and LDL-receptor class A domain-containing protein 1-like [Elysia marginata]